MAKPNLYSEHFQGYFKSCKLTAPNLFDYLQLVDFVNDHKSYFCSTYTVKLYVHPRDILKSIFFKYAPTAIITQVSFRNGRATYLKLKD